MDKMIAQEIAYKNGYEKGKEILSYNFSQSYIKGLLAALEESERVRK